VIVRIQIALFNALSVVRDGQHDRYSDGLNNSKVGFGLNCPPALQNCINEVGQNRVLIMEKMRLGLALQLQPIAQRIRERRR
jgi:hypothetical protein